MKGTPRGVLFALVFFVFVGAVAMFLLVDEAPSEQLGVPDEGAADARVPLTAVEVEPEAPVEFLIETADVAAVDAFAVVDVSFLWPADASTIEPAHEVRLLEGAWARAENGALEVPASAEALTASLRVGSLFVGRVDVPVAPHLTFDLREHPAIQGRVVGWSGPITGATVRVSVPGRHRVETTTGPGGDFFFAGLAADEHYELSAHAEGWSSWTAEFVTAEPPAAGVRHAVELTASGAIRGRVVETQGAAVSDAGVTVLDRGRRRQTRSARDGTFHLDDITAWPATVTVETDDGLIGWTSVPDVPRGLIDVVARPAESLEGRLQWEDGEPVMSLLVATPLDSTGNDLPAHARPVLMRFTGSHGDGSFLVRDLVSDRLRLETDSLFGYSAVHSTDEPVVITLPRVEEFELRARPGDGATTSELTFDVRSGRSQGTRREILHDGHYTIRASAPQDAEVVVSVTSAGGVLTEVTRGTPTQLDGLVVEVRPPAGRRVTFRVVDERGEPLAGAKLSPMWPVSSLESSLDRHIASDSPFPGFQAATAVLRTNELGEASVEVPGEVPIELFVTLDDHRAFRQRFEPGAVPAVVLEPAKRIVVIPSDGSRRR